MATNIPSKTVIGAPLISQGVQAAIGGVAAAAGLVGLAYLKPPQAVSQSKYLGDMMFPGDLLDNRSAYIAIQFKEYERRSIFEQPFLNAIGGIRLPLPNQLTENQQVQWNPQGTDAASGAAIEAGLKGRSSGGSIGAISLDAAMGYATGAINKATTAAAGSLGIDTAQALQLGGLAQNPFLTVLFQSPNFKKHSFSWKLAPNNAQESNTVKDIINSFKSNMLPALSGNAGGTLLTYPNMAIINLFPDDSYLYKFKPCVIESIDVNYATGGQPSFFRDTNAPVEVQLSVNFLEIEYWLKEDIENNSFRGGAFGFG
jgi:hypothetical protein